MSVDKAAKGLIHGGIVNDGLLNKIEMAFRAYDPCNACSTHSLPGQMPLTLRVRGGSGEILRVISR
jgi:F420-non-reducing hydrogenase large subunit